MERYHFLDTKGSTEENSELDSKIHYDLLLTYQEEDGLLSFLSKKDGLFQQLLAEYATEKDDTLHNLQRLQGYLLLDKERLERRVKELSHPSFQESHKRWLKLPSEYYKDFTQVRRQAARQYEEVNSGEKRHSDEFLNNLVCRYMVAKEYNYKEVLEHTLAYIKGEHGLAQSYDLTSFRQFHEKDVSFASYSSSRTWELTTKAGQLCSTGPPTSTSVPSKTPKTTTTTTSTSWKCGCRRNWQATPTSTR